MSPNRSLHSAMTATKSSNKVIRIICKRNLLTSIRFNLCVSRKSLDAISVPIYHPLNGHAVNSSPPQSNSRDETAGNAYHFKPSSAKLGNLKKEVFFQ